MPSKKNTEELKNLMRMWNRGTFEKLSKSLKYHWAEHGNGMSFMKYLRKAANFNYKGAIKKTLNSGRTRWTRKSGEYIIKRGDKIVSYGKNRVR